MPIERRAAGLMFVLALSSCGPQVAVADGDSDTSMDDAEGSTSSPPTASGPGTSPDATSNATLTTVDASSDPMPPDTGCLGECGVECFADDDCGPGGFCRDDDVCGTFPQLEPCGGPAMLEPPEVLAMGDVDDVELGDLEGDGDLDIVAITGSSAQLMVLLADEGAPLQVDPSIDLPSAAEHVTLGDDDQDGRLEAFEVSSIKVYRHAGDAVETFGPRSDFTELNFPAVLAAARIDDDPVVDLVVITRFLPSLIVYFGSGTGTPAASVATEIEPGSGLGDRFAFAPHPQAGMTVAIAAAGDVRRFRSLGDGTFDEGNGLRVVETARPTSVTDVAILAWGGDDGERLGAIANVLDFTIVSLADFENGAARLEQRWALAEPSVRIGVTVGASFDFVLGTESELLLAVRGDRECYEAHPLPAEANEIAIGDVTGDGSPDVLVATNGGLVLLRAL